MHSRKVTVQLAPLLADMAEPRLGAGFKLTCSIALLFVNNLAMPVDFGGQIELFSKESDAIIIRPE